MECQRETEDGLEFPRDPNWFVWQLLQSDKPDSMDVNLDVADMYNATTTEQ